MLKMRVGDISFLEIVKKNAIFVGEGITYYLTEIIFICEFPGTWCICICICGQYSICQWCGLPRVLSDLSQNWFSRCSHCCCCHHCHHCHHCFCPGHRHHQNCYHIHRSHDSHHHYHNCSSHLFLSINKAINNFNSEFVILPAGAISWPQKWTWEQVWFSSLYLFGR